MKKALTLLLALTMLLGLAMPAAAYTANVAKDGSPFTVGLYLVEYDNLGDRLVGWLKEKPVDRAYTKNEVVAAIGSILVPSRENVYAEGYHSMEFSGKNVTFRVTENMNSANRYELNTNVPANSWSDPDRWSGPTDGSKITMELDDPTVGASDNFIPVVSSKKTYRWLVFAKITKDNSSITLSFNKQVEFTPIAGAPLWTTAGIYGGTDPNASDYLVLNEDYLVIKAGKFYDVYENTDRGGFSATAGPGGNLLFRIETGNRGKTERLLMYTRDYGGPVYRVLVEPSARELIFIVVSGVSGKQPNDQIKINEKGYKSLLSFYNGIFEEGLGFTAYNEGNYMTDKDWERIASKLSLSAKVEMEPWVDYPRA